MTLQLTADQQKGYSAMVDLLTTNADNLVILGGAGTGKTTLVNTFMYEWEQLVKLTPGTFKEYAFYLTATTNKAADALANATGRETSTIHSLLGLRVVSEGYRKSCLVDNGTSLASESVIFIDESSFIDDALLQVILRKTKGHKVIFLGDHCQLKPVNSDTTPVFSASFPTVELKQIVRQSDDSPIQTLSRNLRAYVDGTISIPKAGVNGVDIIHMDKEDFIKSFTAECVTNTSVRALAWRNATTQEYNRLAAEAVHGDADFKVGHVVTVNKQIQERDRWKLPTDSTIEIAEISSWFVDSNGITARHITTTHGIKLKQAQDHSDAIAAIKTAYANGNHEQAYILENMYADLRLMYASTVNKAQGSTYHTVYIDLDDIGRCRDADQVKRMLYVAASRASHKVVFTGDL